MGCNSRGYWYRVNKSFIYCALVVLFRVVWVSAPYKSPIQDEV